MAASSASIRRMLRAAADRIEEALEASPRDRSRATETLLLVVGRGASDPDANSNVAKVMRMLWEGMGFGWGEVAYSGVTFPLVAPALDHAVQARLSPHRRLPVFPVHRRAREAHLRCRRRGAGAAIPISKSSTRPISTTTRWSSTPSLDRIREMLVGQNLMNCAMCKYREQVLGFEAEVGLAQESHHHHVEGIGGGLENCPCGGDCDSSCRDEAFCDTPRSAVDAAASHDHGHGMIRIRMASHGHPCPLPRARDRRPALTSFAAAHARPRRDHHHHPYPHAQHPLGPVTLPKDPGQAGAARNGSE